MDIKAGDLVMVVRGAKCGCMNSVGYVFVVGGIDTRPFSICMYCRKFRADGAGAVDSRDGIGVAVSRLIKIDPPALPESITQDQEITV